MGVDLGTFLKQHPEYLPDRYKFIQFDGIHQTVLHAIFRALSDQGQRAYRAQLGLPHLDDRPFHVMEGGVPRNS